MRRAAPLQVVAAMPLAQAATTYLTDELGGDVDIRDIRNASEDADLLLTPPCSPQAIGRMQQAFPRARIIVLELTDWRYDIDVRGPVHRLLAAGASQYLVAPSADALVAFLRSAAVAATPPAVIEADTAPAAVLDVSELMAPSIDDFIAGQVREALARRRAGGQS